MDPPQTPPRTNEPSRPVHDSAVASAVAPAKAVARPPARRIPPYRVLLHNDDTNYFEYVVISILKLTRLRLQDAVARTQEAHTRGVSLLLVTHKERAELYHEQFASRAITVTIEPES